MPSPEPLSRRAAYCDVDGTLAATTIVTPLVWYKKRLLSPPLGKLWPLTLALRGPWWLLLDRFNRSASNRAIYSCYRGLPADAVKARAKECFQAVIEPWLFPKALAYLEALRADGCRVVLVTGSLDFLMRPLAEKLRAELISPSLEERDGRFTGKLKGEPLAGAAKAVAIRAHSQTQGIDLAQSQALGDAWGDLPMLEAAGHPVAVNPDARLSRLAAQRGWKVENWRKN